MKIENIKKYPACIPIVAEWLFNEWGRKISGGSISNAEKALMEKTNHAGIPLSLVAFQNHKPIGVARLIECDMDTRKELSPWVASVFVVKQFRNNGVGKALCASLISEASKLEFSTLYLFTPNMESFYKKQGWEIIEQTIYRNEYVSIMRINIKEQPLQL
jgi:N-acetylglutamate synthase-like GNAT family acetyltransferase